ncbi:GTPase [Candidatus Micrarchaeota archaeon]|nr:GTPase [Candidatus Micrarchaeota archaeon]
MANKTRVIILGAAGRDFQNFNVLYRNDDRYEVVAFTAAQIPDIAGRIYPPELAGKNYPKGIPIYAESELADLIKKHNVEQVDLAYSDLNYIDVMHKASIANAAGADFKIIGSERTFLKSTKPVISVCAVRTGSGKSQTSRKVCKVIKEKGLTPVAIRHPMPYGDLNEQIWQRFATYKDLDKHKTTIEEREEYEPHIDNGTVVFAGVDYEKILREAEKEADIIVWDGGNNDTSFIKPDLSIVVADPHRAGHELLYYPGETNIRLADIVVINKVDSAEPKNIELVKSNVKMLNPKARIIEADSEITVDNINMVKGKRVLIVEDGPTVTHGEMKYGAGYVVAKRIGVKEIIDPRPYAVGSIKKTFQKYTHLSQVLPAMGYGKKQVSELEATINAADCDAVLSATPIDLRRVLTVNKPMVRARYELKEKGSYGIEQVISEFLAKHNIKK